MRVPAHLKPLFEVISRRRTVSGLGTRCPFAVAAGVALLVVFGLQAPALAATPVVSITQPTANSWTNHVTPSFTGTNNESLALMTLQIYSGAHAEGTPVARTAIIPSFPTWSASSPVALAQGRYTALAEEVNESDATGRSTAVTFNVDTTPPAVAMNAVAPLTNHATPQFSGVAGTAEGDADSVTVSIYQGAIVTGTAVQRGVASVSSGKWAYNATHLAEGVYTVQAVQVDEAGNVGASAASTFTVDTTPPGLSIASPTGATTFGVSTPTLRGNAGQASGDLQTVSVKVYAGSSASGTPVQQLQLAASEWIAGVSGKALPNGQYTAVAEQADLAGNVARNSVTFEILASAPAVTLGLPSAVLRSTQPVTAATPSFAGSAGAAPQDGSTITVRIYAGASASGTPLQSLPGSAVNGSWSTAQAAPLLDGTYTAVAEQQDGEFFGHGGLSTPVVFQVDATPPSLTLNPLPGEAVSGSSATVSGEDGEAVGDLPQVSVELFSGASTAVQALETVVVNATEGAWHAAFGDLVPGVYTVRAQQSDDVGNTATSAPVTFTDTGSAPASPAIPSSPATPSLPAIDSSAATLPSASFEWFPRSPRVGETVSFVSTSTDLASPITSYAWAFAPSASWQPGTAVLHTSFAVAGQQHVRLRVSDALGQVQLVENVVQVSQPEQALIQPFPIVRIVGSDFRRSVHLKLLSVVAPLGSTVSVTCRGGGCPSRSQTVQANTLDGDTGLALVVLARYKRPLRAGAIVQIEVSKAGEIGKYTRLEVRRGKLPTRVDMCLSVSGTPVACPR